MHIAKQIKSSWICSPTKLLQLKHGFRQPAFWQYPCCTFALSPWSSTMWVCVSPQSVACALAQGRLFCKVGFYVSGLCALQMCLAWCVGIQISILNVSSFIFVMLIKLLQDFRTVISFQSFSLFHIKVSFTTQRRIFLKFLYEYYPNVISCYSCLP